MSLQFFFFLLKSKVFFFVIFPWLFCNCQLELRIIQSFNIYIKKKLLAHALHIPARRSLRLLGSVCFYRNQTLPFTALFEVVPRDLSKGDARDDRRQTVWLWQTSADYFVLLLIFSPLLSKGHKFHCFVYTMWSLFFLFASFFYIFCRLFFFNFIPII